MNILYLRGFNNYHKRTIIKYSTLEDYQNNSSSFLNYSGINFNPNDGIVTELIVGSPNQKEDNAILMFEDNGSPDYCVCYESTGNSVEIKSRWFILESVRVRGGQYRLALKRDVIADHMDFVLRADCFIKKGQIQDISSPFLFNRENMTYNQIKKREVPLYDSTGVPWIVGYVAKNYDTTKTVTGSINNIVDGDGVDIEDTPFGAGVTIDDVLAGISFTTVSSVNLIWKLQGEYFRGATVGPYAGEYYTDFYYGKMLGRSKIGFYNGGIRYLDNAYGTYYEQKDHTQTDQYGNPIVGGTVETSYGNFAGQSLGEYENLKYNLLPNATTGYGLYPRKSKLKSADQITSLMMAQSFNGRTVAENIVTELTGNLSTEDYSGDDGIMAYNGVQVVVDDNGTPRNFQCVIEKQSTYTDYTDLSSSLASNTQLNILRAFNGTLNTLDDNTWRSDNYLTMYYTRSVYQIKFREIPGKLNVDVTIPNIANRWTCNDQLFDIFCIPYGEITVKDDLTPGGTETVFKTRADAGLAAARAIAQELGSNLYDLQILPYCPIKEIRDAYDIMLRYYHEVGVANYEYLDTPYIEYGIGEFVIDSDDTTQDGFYQRITKHLSGDLCSYVFWAYSSHGTFDVQLPINDLMYYRYKREADSNLLKKKISSETEFIRICSPNYAGVFEYNQAKNNNEFATTRTLVHINPNKYLNKPNLESINVDYTYRPGTPYIHLNPVFKGEDQGAVYGQDFNDIRGLVCGGDFSLGYIVDAYRQYQIQNANFQAIFDRQIQNLDTNNAIAKEQTQFASIMGAIGAPVGGAVTGGLAGAKAGPYGAIAGAVVGGVGGTAGGLIGYNLNMDWLERQQQETRDYSIDMYNYHLGNIKALPYSIAKTDCLAENTRLVPFIEVYEATEVEVNNLINVMKYNGMTVMAIGKPQNFIGLDDIDANTDTAVNCKGHACYYIQADLIMNPEETLDDDFHIMDAIYAELSKGVYLQGTYEGQPGFAWPADEE